MSEVKVNKISPRTACGTTTLGDSGDTFTIPAGVTISNSGTATGFGGTGEISWSTTVKTTGTFTATAGVGYFLNTSGGTITVNLPAGAAGSSVALADYGGNWQTNAVTVTPNGTEKMGGVASSVTLNTEGQSVTFVYIDSTQGWVNVLDSTSNVRGNPYIAATGGTITTSGNDKIHTFTGPGTFTVCGAAVCAANNVVSYLVIAGGGSGGKGNAGGGGAGGYRELKSPSTPYTASPLDGYPSAPNRVTVSATAYPIAVGGGGAASTGPYTAGTAGSTSTFSTISSAGGGFGAAYPAPCGGNGGSGGGSGASINPSGAGGSGNTPPTTPPQGQNGGSSPCSGVNGAAGGGGAGAAGANKNPSSGGAGGAGVTSEINASPVQRAGGGGGWGRPGPGGAAGAGGGGIGTAEPGSASPPGTTAGAGTANTGGGGGGSGNPSPTGGAGGSGLVIIRYRYQ